VIEDSEEPRQVEQLANRLMSTDLPVPENEAISPEADKESRHRLASISSLRSVTVPSIFFFANVLRQLRIRSDNIVAIALLSRGWMHVHFIRWRDEGALPLPLCAQTGNNNIRAVITLVAEDILSSGSSIAQWSRFQTFQNT
jgi:hypothetical protein